MAEMVEVHVVPWTETLLTTVDWDVDDCDDDEVYRLPAGLVEAYELAVKTVYDLGETVVGYAEGRDVAADPTPAGAAPPMFGDPRYCWNPVRHLPHDFEYQVAGGAGRYHCDGNGETAAHALGYQQAHAAADGGDE